MIVVNLKQQENKLKLSALTNIIEKSKTNDKIL